MKIMFVGCDETPERYRQHIGRVIDWWEPGAYERRPVPGVKGMLAGIPGVLTAAGDWEIRPVDMRSDDEKWLDEADAILRDEPKAGDRLDVAQTQAMRAQWLILKALSARTRRLR